MAIDTKRMIAEKLFEILEHKKIDHVTVKYLVEYCHISRQTFYYHFQDIMDVLEWGLQQALEHDLERTLAAEFPREAIGIFVGQTLRRREAVQMLLNSQRRAEFERMLLDGMRTFLRELFRRKNPNPQLPVADVEMMLDFYVCGIAGLLMLHCGRQDVSEEVLVDQIYRLLSGEMQRCLVGEADLQRGG